MNDNSLRSISPLDGRYHQITQPLAAIFSEQSLIYHRLKIEIHYLLALSATGIVRSLSKKEVSFLESLQSSPDSAKKIKKIEEKIHHDVKSVEYYLAKRVKSTSLKDCIPFIHFGITTNDINNLSYRLMISEAIKDIIIPKLKEILLLMKNQTQKYHNLPILARTHGQAAIPTTFGKEVSVFGIRLLKQLQLLETYKLSGKFNGAAGSFQALQLVKPEVDWIKFSKKFVNSLKLIPNIHSTQVNPADDIVALFHILHIINSILIDLDQDFWRYISDDWLVQAYKDDNVGSSTMPQKINPIEFENSEGNLTLANGLIEAINRKLPINRLQRDLSDSTINRNFGSILAYSFIGYQSLVRGLKTIKPNKEQILKDLNHNYNILSEALQTYLRSKHDAKAYQKVSKLTKHQVLTQEDWKKLSQTFHSDLVFLTPSKYTGKASYLAKSAVKDINLYLQKKGSKGENE